MKKVIALLLGAVFLAFPFAGCKDKAEKEPNIVYSFTEEGDISAKQGDQTLVETKFSYAYHVEMKGRYLWEDSSLKEDLYAELAGKEIALEKTEETALPQGITIKIRLPLLQSFDILSSAACTNHHYAGSQRVQCACMAYFDFTSAHLLCDEPTHLCHQAKGSDAIGLGKSQNLSVQKVHRKSIFVRG